MSGVRSKIGTSLVAQTVVCLQRRRPGFNPRVGKFPWRRKWQPTPVLLPGKSHGWRSLVGYSPWGRKELNTTEQIHFLEVELDLPGSASGKEPGCQCRRQEAQVRPLGPEDPVEEGMATHSSVLAWRIPMDRGAWRATVHRVAESQTRLNRLNMHACTTRP